MSVSTPSGRPVLKFRIHWHVLLIHFPISFFVVSFGFMLLHLFTFTPCFEMASTVTLIAGAVMMVPATLTGWYTWKSRYRGVRGMLFQRKIPISFAMIAISIILATWRTVSFGIFEDILHPIWHGVYFGGTTLLLLGAMAEGYYGGRLNHR